MTKSTENAVVVGVVLLAAAAGAYYFLRGPGSDARLLDKVRDGGRQTPAPSPGKGSNLLDSIATAWDAYNGHDDDEYGNLLAGAKYG